MSDRRHILVLNNIPISYRNALFAEMQELHTAIKFVFLAKSESVRGGKADIEALREVNYRIIEPWFQSRDSRTTTSDIIVGPIPLADIWWSDVLICFGYSYPQILISAIVSRLLGKSTVLFCETTQSETGRGWKWPVKQVLTRALFTRFVVPGEASRRYLAELGISQNKVYIATNAAPHLDGAKTRIRSVGQEGPVRVGFVGRLAPEKNFAWAIETLLSDERLEFHVAGQGPLAPQLAALSPRRVRLYGHLVGRGLAEFYEMIDLLVLPSNAEPWGFVVNEAVSTGCPVVLSSCVGSRFEFQRCSTIFERQNEVSLRAAVDRAVKNISELSKECIEVSSNISVRAQAKVTLLAAQ